MVTTHVVEAVEQTLEAQVPTHKERVHITVEQAVQAVEPMGCVEETVAVAVVPKALVQMVPCHRGLVLL